MNRGVETLNDNRGHEFHHPLEGNSKFDFPPKINFNFIHYFHALIEFSIEIFPNRLFWVHTVFCQFSKPVLDSQSLWLTRQSTTPVYYQWGTLLCERRNSCKGGQHATSGFGIQTVSTCEKIWKQNPKRWRKLIGWLLKCWRRMLMTFYVGD